MQLVLYIADFAINLAAPYTMVEWLDQLGERLALNRDEFQHDQKGDQARVGEPVVAEKEMAGVFATKDGIDVAHFCFDIGMPYATAHSRAAQFVDEFRHALRDDQVV